MEIYITALTLSFTPQVVAAILGGAIGAWISSDRKRYGIQLSFLFFLVALVFSAAMGEYLSNVRSIKSLFWLWVLSVPLGMMVASTLDVIRIANRPLIEKLVNGIAESGVSIVVESVLSKLRRWFGVTDKSDKSDKK